MEYDKLNRLMAELKTIRKLHIQLMLRACPELTPDQGRLLFSIREARMSQRELAKKLHITEATLSVRIKRLVDAGLVERENDRHDKRVYSIVLSEKGKRLTNQMETSIHHYKEMICKGITLEEYETMLKVVKKIQKNLKEEIEC